MELYLEAFFAWLGDVSTNTRRTYTNDLRHFSRWFEAQHGQPPELADLTTMTVVLYKAALVDKLRLKPSSVKRRLLTLKRFCRWAAEQGYIKELPAKGVKIPPVPPSGPRSLDRAAVRALLRAARRDPHKLARRNYAILRVLLDTGIRVGSLVALRLGDIRWTEKRRKATLRVLYGKGKRSNTIPLPYTTRAALEDYLAVRPASGDDHLFLSSRGTALDTDTVRHVINKYARQAGLDPGEVSPHMLRHTLARMLLANGSPLTEVQAILGHAHITSTAIYTQPSEEEKANALERAAEEF
ncbi:MAG: tyrosine-type recombinase/integrase [Anaerolineae bacterium]|nr:tyrosine-type recombinase/integrase [Anaerolineae bacterium]